MAKKAELVVVDAKRHAHAVMEADDQMLGDAERELAGYLEVDLTAAVQIQMERVKADAQRGLETALRMGLRLMAVRAECKHGEFEDLAQAAGVSARESRVCMQLARAYASEGDERRRAALLEMGKANAVVLLTAAPEVRQRVMDSPELLSDALDSSNRNFIAQIKKLKDELESLQNAAQARTSQQDVEAQGHIVTPDIPYEVSDIRRETAALYKQADLAVAAMADLGPMLLDLQDAPKMGKWLVPTATQAYTAMQGLHAKLAVQLAAWRDTFALEVDGLPPITDAAFYQPEEAVLIATHFNALLATHLAEGKRRVNQRANAVVGKLGRKRKDA